FAQRRLVDRIVGYGVALHEGALYGWLNQLVNLLTALGLMLLAVSGVVLWWRRRPDGVLGAPHPRPRPALAMSLIAVIVALGV
ncbi:PepSY domain-containing protein, partial [Listeria monocytogenes]|uniref:PepSY domain-containing protein n=2 Tax=Bacteria TaxID=2 RepID=UPI003FA4119E